MNQRLLFLFLICFYSSGISFANAAEAIHISDVTVKESTDKRFVVEGRLTNMTEESRDVIFRAQLFFYDKTAPKGDLPVSILRRDKNIVLKPWESRKVNEVFVSEAKSPRGSLRLEPLMRIRRQREWNY